MRIAVLDDTGMIVNVIVADDERILPQLGIRNYRVLGDGEQCEICPAEAVEVVPDPPAEVQ
ncbi:hypothetical protein Dsui_0211 [Azospira oryzae PS]|uniref:Uncharacterized protein n=1 Tax=Azospira oryzae (strain ATCC BAA-33 / DSM 13638 / PS) TaxID=640081 RepID=G8QMQ1_AZOOP|nr:hypothetical protein [Azospira oryzae]AEV24631.1 hypothetical protein Dsui_0211 [Azospira oryzae PS]